ncbi:MAG: hypothetical protein IPN81_00225 [Nitrosomonadales bacterium]|nr:hypothetical protein [Nitrosomonadales bacterium]MBL0037985.1 hypothetical protein [Nitrosomonadales bacterium]
MAGIATVDAIVVAPAGLTAVGVALGITSALFIITTAAASTVNSRWGCCNRFCDSTPLLEVPAPQ